MRLHDQLFALDVPVRAVPGGARGIGSARYFAGGKKETAADDFAGELFWGDHRDRSTNGGELRDQADVFGSARHGDFFV